MKTRQEIMLELADERSAIRITELKEEIEHLKAKLEKIQEECNEAPMCDTEFSLRILEIIRGENNDR